MGLRERVRARVLDLVMRQMNDLRADALAPAEGEILEVGFGTGLNLGFYPKGIKSVVGLDPDDAEGLRALDARIARAPFEVERCTLRADGELPFDAGRFDCVVTTWTLCSIPDPVRALIEMRRVLRPGGRYLFIEHGRAPTPGTARWQDRVNPLWRCFTGGCNINRSIDEIVTQGGFELSGLDRFRARGPGLMAHMYRGTAKPA